MNRNIWWMSMLIECFSTFTSSIDRGHTSVLTSTSKYTRKNINSSPMNVLGHVLQPPISICVGIWINIALSEHDVYLFSRHQTRTLAGSRRFRSHLQQQQKSPVTDGDCVYCGVCIHSLAHKESDHMVSPHDTPNHLCWDLNKYSAQRTRCAFV